MAEAWVVLPLAAENLNFNGMLTLNETDSLLWKALDQGSDREALVDALTAEYAMDRDTALSDVDEFLEKFDCLEV